MKKMIATLLIAMLLMSACAFAETAAPSITISQIIVPTGGVEVAEDFVVALKVVAEETEEKKVLDEIIAFVVEEPVATYFGEEVMTVAAAYLPEELDNSTLVMDEFFVLEEENYDENYGDVTATFEFVTPYEDGAVLIAMIGVLPTEEALAENEEAAITWIPIPAVAAEGKVQITFTQDVFTSLQNNKCVCALLRAEDVDAAILDTEASETEVSPAA